MDRLCNSRRGSRRLNGGLRSGGSIIAVDFGLRALARDVAGLAAAVARLSSRVERAAVGSSAVARDVAELAAGVALHGLRLAVARIVVRSAALVAGRRTTAAVATAESTTAAAAISTTHAACAAACANTSVGASALFSSSVNS
jgi:hypothetical protein